MVTPADLARMMANASGEYAQNGDQSNVGADQSGAAERSRSNTGDNTYDSPNTVQPQQSEETRDSPSATADAPHHFTPNDLAKATGMAAADSHKETAEQESFDKADSAMPGRMASAASVINAIHNAAKPANTDTGDANNTASTSNTSAAGDSVEQTAASNGNGANPTTNVTPNAKSFQTISNTSDAENTAASSQTSHSLNQENTGETDNQEHTGATARESSDTAPAEAGNERHIVTPAVIRRMMQTTRTATTYSVGDETQRRGNEDDGGSAGNAKLIHQAFGASAANTTTDFTSIAHVARFTRIERGKHFIKPDGGPTPKMMPLHRHNDRPTKFATLEMQEFPVVREYSAGGLIFDDQQRVAIIARHSRSGHIEWCLPKGHIEKGETPEQTAVREVHEETGILGEVIDSIATIDYWFTGTEERIHKLVHHFALRQIGGELTVEGDPDHEAEDADWVDFKDLDSVLSYPNERKIAWLYAKKLNRQAKG